MEIAMTKTVHTEYNIDEIFAVAVAVNRFNGGYIKQNVFVENESGEIELKSMPNKDLVNNVLMGNETNITVTDQDRETAAKVKRYCSGLTFKILAGKTLSDFERAMVRIAEMETTSSRYDIAIISSLPSTYERSLIRMEQENRLRTKSGCISAIVGSKIEDEIEVVRCNYSFDWNTYYVTGIASDGIVFFAFKREVPVNSTIKIKGKVKAHKEDRTQLSHVKIVSD